MKSQRKILLPLPAFIVLALLIFGGWIANIVKLSDMETATITGMFVLRVIGVFIPPVGAVLGFI